MVQATRYLGRLSTLKRVDGRGFKDYETIDKIEIYKYRLTRTKNTEETSVDVLDTRTKIMKYKSK